MSSQIMKDYTDHVVKNCDGENTVTLVRRRVVYEEKVVSFDEYIQLNRDLNTDEMYPSEIEGFESIGFDDFEEEETDYVAFPGDVTNFTDDAIAFLFNYQPWDDGFDGIHISSYEHDFRSESDS
tara:strand:- start:131 stop:502 length:372 start_codon:yes stop_codon:yes gene_type:complete